VGQILATIAKAVLVTLVSTLAAIGIDKIRRYNEDRENNYYDHPGWGNHDDW